MGSLVGPCVGSCVGSCVGWGWGSEVSSAGGELGRRRVFFFFLAAGSLRLGSFGNDWEGDKGTPSSASLARPDRVRTMVIVVNTE